MSTRLTPPTTHRLLPALLCIGLLGLLGTALPTPAAADSPAEVTSLDWIVEADEAAKLIKTGDPTVLDARARSKWRNSHAPRASHINWDAFTPSKTKVRGTLLDSTSELESKLRKLGVFNGRPVLVIGDPTGGWGEDGRIVWMLRTLGHDSAALVDGGHDALKAAGVEMTDATPEVKTGDFDANRNERWHIDRETLREIYGEDDDVVLLDTREEREYRGETPYGESRRGHIPGARHLHFKDLLTDAGTLKSPSTLRAKLTELGIGEDTRVVAYCTGGVRSAWVVAVLAELGYENVQNYAGSAWEWAASPAETYPLETEKTD